METPPASATPVASIPQWLTPEEFAKLPHDDAGAKTDIVVWLLVGISGCFLTLRVYCKYLRHRGLWWDDWVLVASWLCLLTEACLTTLAVSIGYGKHIWDFPMQNFLRLITIANTAGTFSIIAAIWSKTSFAITLLRITNGWTKVFVWWIIISMNIAMGLSALFIWINCSPVQKVWNPFLPGTCWPVQTLIDYDIFSAAYSGTMDLTLALLPWPLIWRLQMKPKEKLGVAFAMSMGVFAGITAFVKTSKIPTLSSGDPYDGIPLVLWGNAESAVTIVAASVPVLRVLIRDVRTTAARNHAGRRYYDYGTEGTGGRGGGGGNGGRGGNIGMTAKRVRIRSHNNTVEVTTRVPMGNLSGGGLSSSSSREAGSGKGAILADDGSDRSIIEPPITPPPAAFAMARNAGTGIVQTREIAIEYHDRREGDYDMAHLPV